jgi:hypothetical protein
LHAKAVIIDRANGRLKVIQDGEQSNYHAKKVNSVEERQRRWTDFVPASGNSAS